MRSPNVLRGARAEEKAGAEVRSVSRTFHTMELARSVTAGHHGHGHSPAIRRHSMPSGRPTRAPTRVSRYSPLDQNQQELRSTGCDRLASVGEPNCGSRGTAGSPKLPNYQNTPVMVGSLLYISTGNGTVAALDAARATFLVRYGAAERRTGRKPVEAPTRGGRLLDGRKGPAHSSLSVGNGSSP